MTAQNSIAASINSVVNQPDSVGYGTGVVQAIKNAATRTGVDFSYLLKKASAESGLDSTAKAATSSATGLFQFTSQTWLQMVKDHGTQYGLGDYAAQINTDSSGHLSVGDKATKQQILALRNNPQVSAEMAGELDKSNAASLQQSVGGKVGDTELYLAHFLGAGGASDFLTAMKTAPNTTAASVLPTAAAANQSVFYDKSGQPRTVAQIYQHFAAKFSGTDNSAATQVASAASTATASSAAASASGNTVASATANAANVYAAATQKHIPLSLASMFGATSAVNGSTATTSSAAGYRSTDGGTMVLSGSSTLFTAMVMGQMHGSGADHAKSMASLSETDKKKGDYSVLAEVA